MRFCSTALGCGRRALLCISNGFRRLAGCGFSFEHAGRKAFPGAAVADAPNSRRLAHHAKDESLEHHLEVNTISLPISRLAGWVLSSLLRSESLISREELISRHST